MKYLVMEKESHPITSKNAVSSFKSKVNDCLPLLGFLDSDDKGDIWRFWKTVSSAVKIAVNGKGDIVETPRKTSKALRNSAEKKRGDQFLKRLDRDAITIYVPVRCLEVGHRKYRVLKLANQKKIADYFETVAVDGEENSGGAGSLVNDASLEYFDFADLSNSFQGNVGKEEIVEPIVINKEDLSIGEQNVETVTMISQEQNSTFSFEEPVRENGEQVRNPPQRSRKMAWPVGRPVTRSRSSKSMECTVVSAEDIDRAISVKSEDRPEDSVREFSDHQGKEFGVDSGSLFPPHPVKEEACGREQENFSITLVPVDGNVMQITNVRDTMDILKTQNNGLVASDLNKSALTCSSSSVVEKLSNVSVSESHTMLAETVLEEKNSDLNVSNSLLPACKVTVSSGDNKFGVPSQNQPVGMETNAAGVVDVSAECREQPEAQGGPLAQRNASDIETIISALEEELKKSGTEEAKISTEEEMTQSAAEEIASTKSSYFTSCPQTVQLLNGQQIVEVQHVDNVIWTSDGEVQILGPNQVVSTSEVAISGGHPLDAGYDVVEYEVAGDKKSKRGRKKRAKNSKEYLKEDTIDRTCPICQRVLHYASSMAAHMRTHTGVKPYSCGQCDRKFTTKANRDRHEATHVGLKPFQCSACSKCFTEKRSLSVHMRTHTGERPFVCQVCGRAFTQKCTLTAHMDRHTNKKGHLCDLCGKAFRQKCQLDIHVKRHKRQASFPCTECSVKCYTKGDLLRHMIKHTGERPFQCSECPRAFTRKQYLIDHENAHFGRKPYQCSVCGMTFHDVGSCHRHLKKHKMEEESSSDKTSDQSAVLSSGDFHRILEGTKIGQVLKLEDGSNAVVKAVVSEADGSTVYHITCLNTSSSALSTSMPPAVLGQPPPQQQQPQVLTNTEDSGTAESSDFVHHSAVNENDGGSALEGKN
ncbi:gastrula zinc finger protein XlCGF48.2 [Aplysia californica]|uniref:Gastrula zinc finger protein XlCGF48.2 n=1 Tax=Aplysia californica TaxID=6500 RepID=A0ABM0JCZ8_APLCA|nr:gastrula zinc finger protein XlCGF48.2 [Aplysia californica]